MDYSLFLSIKYTSYLKLALVGEWISHRSSTPTYTGSNPVGSICKNNKEYKMKDVFNPLLRPVYCMSDDLLLDELIWGPHTKIPYTTTEQCGHTGNDYTEHHYQIISVDGLKRFDSHHQQYPLRGDLNTASSLLLSPWILCSLTNGARWGERSESC